MARPTMARDLTEQATKKSEKIVKFEVVKPNTKYDEYKRCALIGEGGVP